LTMVLTMVKSTARRTMSISEFRAKCLALMDEVAESGVPIDITRRGKIIGEFRPPTPEEERLFAEGKLEEWKAPKGRERKRGRTKAAR
jgi:antitoxin (DNA-binding transcriptional repressor) of toxin-antitoxin stability system